MASTRQERVQHLLKTEISEILRRELKDPRLGFITIIDSEITPDLAHAKVFVSIMGSEEEREANMAILNRAARFIRQEFGKRVKMKVLPEIEFKLDTSVERGVRMLELLEQIKRDEDEKSS